VDFDPRLVAPGCVYVASKVEECSPLSGLPKLEREVKTCDDRWPYNQKNLMEIEFAILSALDFQLIVYHPYRSLAGNMWLPVEKRGHRATRSIFQDSGLPKDLFESVWATINDSYYTDVCLVQPPYVVAVACLLLVATKHTIDIRSWFAELDVDMKQVWLTIHEILVLHETWDKDRSKETSTDLASFASAFLRLTNHHHSKQVGSPPVIGTSSTSVVKT